MPSITCLLNSLKEPHHAEAQHEEYNDDAQINCVHLNGPLLRGHLQEVYLQARKNCVKTTGICAKNVLRPLVVRAKKLKTSIKIFEISRDRVRKAQCRDAAGAISPPTLPLSADYERPGSCERMPGDLESEWRRLDQGTWLPMRRAGAAAGRFTCH
jgi:hypothetical protein